MADAPGRGLYVHVPFCARRCPYCDFDFEVGRAPDVDGYLGGIVRELDARSDELARAELSTLYLGGGTPSLLGAAGLARLLAIVGAHTRLAQLEELTVELNPEHVDDALLAALCEGGASRVSLGVQSFDDVALAQLGRMHDRTQATLAVTRCVGAGLRTSVDLIVGWPGQGDASLHDDLARTIASGAEHVSVYGLTIEPGTPWPKLVRRGLRQLPDDDQQADALLAAERELAAAGFAHYEVASYARPGAQARHNALYWRWQSYLGVGPSAASAHYGDEGAVMRRTNPRGLAHWLAGAAPECETLAPEAAAGEGLWLGLRMLEGLDVGAWSARFPEQGRSWLASRVASAVTRGDLQWQRGGTRLAVRTDRWLQHDAICAPLLS